MRYTSALHSEQKISVLGLGCAPMMGRSSRKESMAALHGAWDAGITFYDVARSYGGGQAETVLGEFLQGRRDQAFVCTKFGILPAKRAGWKQAILPLARKAVSLVPALRGAARKGAGVQFSSNQFTVDVLRESFETSLKELRTDHVDMLLLHAAPPSVLQQSDLLEAMQRLVEQGKVRMAGISGSRETMDAYFAAPAAPLSTAQFVCNIFDMDITRQTPKVAASGQMLVANHPFGGPSGVAETKRRIEALKPSLAPSLQEKLDLADPQLMPEIVLNCILTNTGISAVVPAMMRPQNLQANVQAINQCRFSADELDSIRHAMMGA